MKQRGSICLSVTLKSSVKNGWTPSPKQGKTTLLIIANIKGYRTINNGTAVN